MKQYTMCMAVVASLLVVILLGTVLMQNNEPKDVTPAVTKTNTTLPIQPVDSDDTADQAVTVQDSDIEQTVTVAE